MLLHLIYAAIVALIVFWAMATIELSTAGYDVVKERKTLSKLGANGLAFTLGGACLVGGLFFVLQEVAFSARWLFILIGIAAILLCCFVLWWATRETKRLLHCIMFCILAAVLFYVMDGAAGKIVASGLVKAALWVALIKFIPWMFLIWMVWYFIMHYIKVHHEQENHVMNEECFCGAAQVITTALAILATIIAGFCFFKSPAAASETAPAADTTTAAVTTTEPTTEPPTTTVSQDELDRMADEAVGNIILEPAEVDQVDLDRFYAKHSKRLMTNTWPTYARDRKDDSAYLLNGKGLYGAVEFPVDVALAKAMGYKIDHEGGYTEEELETIRVWIVERLKSGTLSDFERAAIIDWIVERIARDPIYGNMWAQALAQLHSQSGKSVRDMYPWLDRFVKEWDDGKRLEQFAARYTSQDGLYIHPDYEPIAYAIATAIERMTVVKIDTPTAYHFRMEDLPEHPSEVTTVKAPDMESLAAAVLAAFDKNLEVFKERLGANVIDGRAEVIPQPKKVEPTTVVPTTPAPTTPTPTTPAPTCPPTTPAPTTPVPTTPAPTCPPTTPAPTTPAPTEPTTEPPTTPQYTKDPSKGMNPTEEEKVRPNDDKGPGPNTNPTDPATDPSKSAKDSENNSPSYPSYDDYKKEMEEKKKTNESQKTGKDNNTPTPTTAAPTTVAPTTAKPTTPTTTAPTTTVNADNNGDIGNGGGEPINNKTPTESKVNYTDPASPTTGPISNETRESWGGPSD